jgi:hypothetical protein
MRFPGRPRGLAGIVGPVTSHGFIAGIAVLD